MPSEPKFDALVPHLRQLLNAPTFELQISSEWGSAHQNHRVKIRQFIQENIISDAHVLDLEQIPQLPNGKISISHNKCFGGVAWISEDRNFGFDIEITSRCRPEMIQRVSTQDEMQEAPSMAALWTAKEAAFKSIDRQLQPASVSLIKIGNWKKISGAEIWKWQILSVSGLNIFSDCGILLQIDDQTLAFFIKSFTT